MICLDLAVPEWIKFNRIFGGDYFEKLERPIHSGVKLYYNV